MKILLVWVSNNNQLIPNLLPLGLGYLASNLPKNYQVKMWDGILNRYSDDDLLAEIDSYKPDVIGFSVWNFNIKQVSYLVKIIKEKYPQIYQVIGGVSASGYREEILNIIDVNYVFTGEGEKPFADFLRIIDQGKLSCESLKKINGLIFKDKQKGIVINHLSWFSLKRIKNCDYNFINLNKYLENGFYYGIFPKGIRTVLIATTRGCPFSCQFCTARSINGQKIRTRSVKAITEEIRDLYLKYNIRGFNIIDDNFTFNFKFAKAVCRNILKLRLADTFFSNPNGVKFEYLDEELLNLMKNTGWRNLYFAPESGSKKIRQSMKKPFNITLFEEKVRLVKRIGLNLYGFFIIGYPGEKILDIKKTVDFACRYPFDGVVISCFKPLPGSPVYQKLIKRREISPSQSDGYYHKITYAPKGITFNRLRLLRLWGVFRFYTSSPERFVTALSIYPFERMIKHTLEMFK